MQRRRHTIERAKKDAREGKSPSTQAGEFVHEEIEHIREGKHGARSAKQAIAIGLSKARRAGVKLRPQRKRRAATLSRRSSVETGRRAATTAALSRHARTAARQRTASERSASARKAARTKGAAGRSAAARKAARTRARRK